MEINSHQEEQTTSSSSGNTLVCPFPSIHPLSHPSIGQGVLKYSHSSPIQCVRFNPAKLVLVSCSDNDFGFWSPDYKQVAKEKVGSRILSAAWTSSGESLAIGMQSGVISLRNAKGEETGRIERKAPIWSVLFLPADSITNRTPPIATPGGSPGSPTPTAPIDAETLGRSSK